MAAPNSANVRVSSTGAVRRAPLGTTAPTTSVATYAAGWTEVGLISEDGVTQAMNIDTEEFRAWQNGATVRQVITGSTITFSFTALERNAEVWSLYYAGSTSETTAGATTMTVVSPRADRQAFAFDLIDGARHLRIVVPQGEVTERGDVQYVNGSPELYEFTLTAYPNSDDEVMFLYSDDPAVAATA